MTQHSLIQLTNGDAIRLTPNGTHSGMDITIQNLDESEYVYLGAEGLNSEDFGYRLAPGGAWSVELSGNDSLYAVALDNAYIAVLTVKLESGE